ncbi:uncharacterized protein LOC122044154 [Zingiber officinale]|uniref:uncharacterized protein LOC122044154 n=1 Tax=Zingiber officinale TaxID=94328 RepID=UPI001C4B84F5|nr:uncharacterized protein LOC122044154 [Zingiber officinale]
MPFELKNAAATYQRMMNKVFRKQIGRNLEVYFEDILIKSLQSVDLCADVEETCQTLRHYEIKLNPPECLFGAKGERFLGYIVTEREIEANPGKVKALQDMPPPRNLKEVQRLTGRITALSRFISKSSDRSLPFFKILRQATRFQWDEVCDRAFEELKQYLSSLPILAKPIVGEPLWIYLSSTEYAIGSTLVSHKAQALVDFVTEVQNPEPETAWTMYMDGSSARQGSGIDILLISPREARMQLSIRLDYQATNNEAEYEALIAGLQAARHVGATKVLLHSDSQLAVQQLNGMFEINSVRLTLYAEAFKKLKGNSQEVVIQKIPRSENQVADELAKLASTVIPIVTSSPIEQVSLVACVDRSGGILLSEDWRSPIIEFLQSVGQPGSREADRTLQKRAARFTLVGEQLYKEAFSHPLLKCVGAEDAEYILQEWGMDIVGPFPMVTGQRKFLLIAVDYFSKWVKVEPLAKITESMIKKFVWQNIICRFGIPRRLISDNGRQFTGQELKEWCDGYDIQQAFTSVAYP